MRRVRIGTLLIPLCGWAPAYFRTKMPTWESERAVVIGGNSGGVDALMKSTNSSRGGVYVCRPRWSDNPLDIHSITCAGWGGWHIHHSFRDVHNVHNVQDIVRVINGVGGGGVWEDLCTHE
jgi:hypothetical protein